MARRKFYVVWEGRVPGIYDKWEDAFEQVDGYEGAKYKGFDDQEAATAAFRGNPKDHIGLIAKIARQQVRNQEAARQQNVRNEGIAVDGASSGNPGPIEYRGVRLRDGKEIFHVGPLQGGTNNIAEYLALVHALALLDKYQRYDIPIYSDSRTAQSWVRQRKCKTKVEWNRSNEPLRAILERANTWLENHTPQNPILKWDTENWGEIPADFGRK